MTKKRYRLLVIDDDPMVLKSCRRILEADYDLRFAETGTEGLGLLESEPFDLALLDLKLPDFDGMDILRGAPDRFAGVPIVIITGYSTVKGAVEAVKLGAVDYVAKPFTPEELQTAVSKALQRRRSLEELHDLRRSDAGRRLSPLIGESPAIRQALSLVSQVARTESTVLLTGESGTGKELFARAIHLASARKGERFVAVDCGAIPATLIASELFGHVKGAFTGASTERSGLIQSAKGGTLFLDEIGNLSFEMQASLLRVIEAREVRPVGSTRSQPIDIRLIAATNRDLESLVEQGVFRHDLYYRLNVFPIKLPPLRERREDVAPLCSHFLALHSARIHKRIEDFTAGALELLSRYDWPGNVRELSNVVERLAILSTANVIGLKDLKGVLSFDSAPEATPATVEQLNQARRRARSRAVEQLEKAFLLEALQNSDYNVTRAAQRTGMQRSHLQSLMKKYGLRIKDLLKSKPNDY
jgi:DNA-binding NtrC family response regulator